MSENPPVKKPKPALALWIFERELTLHQVAAEIECSAEQVRRFCLPFGHPNRRTPDAQRMTNIVRYTAGQITPADFYPPEARGQGGQQEARP